MTDRFGILSCRTPSLAVALSLAANLVWIPQALILADIVASVAIGTDAERTGLSPVMLASRRQKSWVLIGSPASGSSTSATRRNEPTDWPITGSPS